MRGVSGGERKRVSIGVELLSEPSILFLDEPTTGLDSETALKIVLLLKEMAEQGRTIISTLHQPSSQIYNVLHHLLLLSEGHLLFQGHSQQAIDHFHKQGYLCPLHANPSDYFMKLMVHHYHHSTHQQFISKITNLAFLFKSSLYFQQIKHTLQTPLKQILTFQSPKQTKISQFKYIFIREIKDQFRNPKEIQALTLAHIIFALLTVAVYFNLGSGQIGIQNRKGLILFISMMMGFSSVQSTLFMFSSQKPLFIRETINHTFEAGPYFLGKSLSALPFQIIYASIYISIVYFWIGLNQVYWWKFFITLGIVNLSYQTGVSYGMLLSIAISSLSLAMSLTPVLLIPFVLMSGFFVNTNNLPWIFKPIEYMSIFKYSYQAIFINEFTDISPFQCDTPCDPLGEAGFKETLSDNFYILLAISFLYRLLSYIGLRYLSKPPKCQIIKTQPAIPSHQIIQQQTQ